MGIVLPNIIYCEKKGLIPVIDTKTYACFFSEANSNINIWEEFYEQYDNNELTRIENLSDHYIKRRCDVGGWRFYNWKPVDVFFNNAVMQEFCRLYNKYVKLNSKMSNLVEQYYSELIPGGAIGHVVGVSARGTDYTALKPYGHYIQPSVDMIIKKTEECMKKWGCSAIYLSTEDETISKAFRNHFNKMVYMLDEKRFDSIEELNMVMFDKDGNHDENSEKFISTQQYIISKALCSKCDYFISGITSGSISVIGMNNGRFNDTYIFSLGRYGITDV